MTMVRTCPVCDDRVSAGDSFCEGCGGTLPDDVRDVPGEPDSVITAPQESLSGARPGADDGSGPGRPQKSGRLYERTEAVANGRSATDNGDSAGNTADAAPDTGRYEDPDHSTGPSLTDSLAVDSDWDEIDMLATQPVRRDTVLPSSEDIVPPASPKGASPAWPPPASGSNPVQPTNPGLCVWCPGRVSEGYCEKCGYLQPTGRDHVQVRARGAFGVSDVGLRHKHNEDAMSVRVVDADDPRAPGTVCAVVCDGVSSSPRSDEASRVTAETGATVLAEQMRQGAEPREATAAAMTRAAEAVAAIADSPDYAPACTFVSAIVRPDTGAVTVGWVGDSRAYWLSSSPEASSSALLTRDDSWAEAMMQMGALSKEEAMQSGHAHALVAWMGADSGEIDAHISSVTPQGPGAIVLCSDGLWNYYPEAQDLTDAVPGAGTAPQEAAHTYVRLALEGGGKDNITVVVIPVHPGGPRVEQH